MFNFWGSAKHSEQKLSTEMQKNGEGPLSHRKIKCLFLDYVQLLMIGRVIWAKNVDQNRKKWKRPPRSSKNKMFVFWITFNFWWSAEWSEQITLTEAQKNEKSPPSHWKIKCLFLDYIQLLMIGRVIWAKNVDRNAKKWKRPPKSSKNKMFVFGLHSTSDDRPSNLSKKMLTKTQKNEKGPLSHRKIKCLFLDYIQLLMIGRAIWAKMLTKTHKNEKGPVGHWKIKCLFFGLRSTSDDRPSYLSK